MLVISAALGAAASVGCGAPSSWSPRAPGASPTLHEGGHLHGARGPGLDSGTWVQGARVVPEVGPDERAYGTEHGGGLRAILSGIRVVTMPNGVVLAADDRLPQPPSVSTTVPDRLGGGFLFVLGSTVWRADRWLSPLHPIFTAPSTVSRLIVGLDRMYARTASGAPFAFDARTGARLDAGPWPVGPSVTAFGALDGWRALAVVDMRGLVATFDAGASWRPLPLPMEARDIVVSGDGLLVGGLDASHNGAWYEVRADGEASRISTSRTLRGGPPPPSPSSSVSPTPTADSALRFLGRRPLVAAVEQGWPLRDGTALVARDGTLSRVRLDGGAVLEMAREAFPLRNARCDATPLGKAAAFVCAEPRGRTIVYVLDETRGTLEERHVWDDPRVVLPSGRGLLAVRGGCASRASTVTAEGQAYCVVSKTGAREVVVPATLTSPGSERVVALEDGRVAVVTQPNFDLTRATLARVPREGRRVGTPLPLHFPAMEPEVARILRLGTWLDGFHEIRPGVLGGWVEAGGALLGLEIDENGGVRPGAYVRDLGNVVVSGRFGLGWLPSRVGYETTDGGMTWSRVDLPEPVASSAPPSTASRGCGPIGCTSSGWIRVGWGGKREPLPPEPPPARYATPSVWSVPLDLECELASTPFGPRAGAPPRRGAPSPHGPHGIVGVLGAPSPAASDTTPFQGVAAPALRPDEVLASVEAADLPDRSMRGSPVARLYAWGPKGADWSSGSKWLVRWLGPFGSVNDLASSAAAPSPFSNLDAARRLLGLGAPVITQWTLAAAEDPRHGLLLGRRYSPPETTVLLLEAERPSLEIRREGGEPFGTVDAALRAGGLWFMAAAAPAGDLPATVLYALEGATAREVARVPRASEGGTRPDAVHLARREGTRAVALILEGQPSADRPSLSRWAMPVDPESGAVGEPERLGAADLTDRGSVPVCEGDEGGWRVELPWPGAARLHLGDGTVTPLQTPIARIHFAEGGTCVEAVAGSLDVPSAQRLEGSATGRPSGVGALRPGGATLPLLVATSVGRRALRCTKR